MPRPLLMVGDIHLGRTPHRLEKAGLLPRTLGPAEAWRRLVRYAEEAGVQAVVLAGDVVDRAEDRFEAYGQLEQGARQLAEAGIRVLGVAGNHDPLALPRLAARLADFTLLGPGGTWQRVELEGLDLLGWSFPSRHHPESPLDAPGLESALLGARAGVPLVAVLHAHLDAGSSPYAPVSRAALRALPVAAWFLGHVHRPDPLHEAPLHEGPLLGYLGTLVGLDRSEVGPRGPWLVQPGPDGRVHATHHPLGPLAWLELEVDLSRVELAEEAADALHAALERGVVQAATAHPELHHPRWEAVGCSVRLVGRVAHRARLGPALAALEGRALRFELPQQPWVIVHVEDQTLPALDLERLASEPSPAGQLARLLLGRLDLPEAVLEAMEAVEAAPWGVDPEPLPPREERLHRAALTLLEQLLAQREGRP